MILSCQRDNQQLWSIVKQKLSHAIQIVIGEDYSVKIGDNGKACFLLDGETKI